MTAAFAQTHQRQQVVRSDRRSFRYLARRRPRGTRSRPPSFSAGFRAYTASKLGDLLIARGLAASGEAKTKNLNVVAYNPGLTVGTSLFRAWPLWAKIAIGVVSLVRPFARMNTVEISGKTLAELALERITPPSGRIYASLNSRKLEWPDPSELAQRDDVMQRLWRESGLMVGFAE